MKKYSKKLSVLLILFVIWLNLNGNISPFTIITGLIICPLAIFITWELLPQPLSNVSINPFKFIKYILFLFVQIYKSGFQMPSKIFNKNIFPLIVTVETKLQNKKLQIILANSITITPGTITLKSNSNKLTILWLPSKDSDFSNPYKEIVYNLEKELLKLE